MGYTVEIVEPTTPWRFNPSELARRNSHGVPQDKIEKMLERYQHGVTVDSILASSRKPTRERQVTYFTHVKYVTPLVEKSALIEVAVGACILCKVIHISGMWLCYQGLSQLLQEKRKQRPRWSCD